MAPSSPRDNFLPEIYIPEAANGFRDFCELVCGPRGKAAAVGTKNVPPARFLNAPTVLQALIRFIQKFPKTVCFREFLLFESMAEKKIQASLLLRKQRLFCGRNRKIVVFCSFWRRECHRKRSLWHDRHPILLIIYALAGESAFGGAVRHTQNQGHIL